ncbi:malonate decarboxylase holo-ACP synthase [Trinickia symbiotica]|uniref:Malonate decarboxylase holo-ACP synthase n=1 Tax=Trinickia symbiotica TaxID=863227 RepID=A0A2T3XUP9_9BURK|nr:malonate decarboxylase holo-ACP synthase [Trinickia symbiotica]PTB20253.1 malonate decarboxylase holo-ACP synthase [Trinickia symbiotica]
MERRLSEVRYRPHDLLRLRRLPTDASGAAPAWVVDAFKHAPFAVVRRAHADPGIVAVGLRGTTRAQRYAAFADERDIEATFTPDCLVRTNPPPARASLPPFVLLRALVDSACLAAFEWGPAGSAAFELATGVPTITPSSDLDLLIRAPTPLSHDDAQRLSTELHAHAARAGLRIDVQLDAPAGGVALAEWALRKPRTMVRSTDGPRLVADPWSIESAAPAEVT